MIQLVRNRFRSLLGPAHAPALLDRPAVPGAPGLEVDTVSKSFGPAEVLRNVSLVAQAGELVTLLGPSGCGKTTLLRIIAGLETADEGSVRLAGRDVGHLPAQRRPVNTVFQSYALFPHLDVYENVAFGLRARRLPEAEIHGRVERTLAMLQIDALARRMPALLSGGQKQRVALARALVNEPEVLLLDEPLSALDAKLRAEVQVELRRLQRTLGRTFLLVTHDQDEAMSVSDRILVMRAGTIEQAGSPAEVYERPATRFVAEFLGSANLIPASSPDSRGLVQTELGPLRPHGAPAWSHGTLVIRPERVLLERERPAENGVRVRVRECVYRGDHMDVWVEPGRLRVRLPPRPLAAGDELWAHLQAEHLEVLRD
jgi:spermidine/putrescine transport system ATP-binding protein